MDSQSVKNTDTAGHKGYDAGKKVSGIKRHIAVDTQGLPHAIHVTTADVTDRAGALAMFDRRRDGLEKLGMHGPSQETWSVNPYLRPFHVRVHR